MRETWVQRYPKQRAPGVDGKPGGFRDWPMDYIRRAAECWANIPYDLEVRETLGSRLWQQWERVR